MRSLRNSAGKRKVAKMFGKFERKEESRQHNENPKGQFSTETYTDAEWRKENGLLESTNVGGYVISDQRDEPFHATRQMTFCIH